MLKVSLWSRHIINPLEAVMGLKYTSDISFKAGCTLLW